MVAARNDSHDRLQIVESWNETYFKSFVMQHIWKTTSGGVEPGR